MRAMEEGARDRFRGRRSRGCPYAPGATGNVATEDVVYMLEAWRRDRAVETKTGGGPNEISRLTRPPVSRVAAAINASKRSVK